VIAARAVVAAALVIGGVGSRERAASQEPPPAVARDAPTSTTPPRDESQARALIAKFECNRCHDGTGLAAAPADRHCVQCHREIRAGTFAAAPADLAIWQDHLHSLLVAPSLAHVGDRGLRRAWVAAFLQHPIDVRPGLPASMPRLAIDATDAAILAAYLVPFDDDAVTAAPPAGGDIAAGAQLFVDRGCVGCHRLTGATLPPASAPVPAALHPADAIALAPDLALARARLRPDRVVAWIVDPIAVDPATLMPRLGVTAVEARDLAAFVLRAPLAPPPAPPPPETRLPVLARAVGFDEVSARVFRKVCWHCHAQPDYALGDGGPGNTGGFGFLARGLDLSSYEGAASGSRGDDGRRRGIFGPLPDGTPRVIAHLMARRREEQGVDSAIRGMPLGFPALSLEEIQLVETWIDQGRPE